jgi:hypothetical protein
VITFRSGEDALAFLRAISADGLDEKWMTLSHGEVPTDAELDDRDPAWLDVIVAIVTVAMQHNVVEMPLHDTGLLRFRPATSEEVLAYSNEQEKKRAERKAARAARKAAREARAASDREGRDAATG